MKKITFSGNYSKLTFLLFFIFSLSTYGQTTILSEDFNSITTGNSVETGMSSSLWTGNANFPADGILRAYQAGGAVRLGTSSQIGYITTMPLDLSPNGGNFMVILDVKGWTTVEGAIKITLFTPSGQTEQTITYTATMSGTFETKTVTFTGGEANSTIRIETTLKRAFIDNVVISTFDCGDIEEPLAEAQSFCGSATVADFIPYGEGIQWYASETGGAALTTTDVIVTGTYYVSQTIGTCESNRVPVSIAINAVPAAPDAQEQTLCGGATILNLAANGSDLQWYTSATGGEALAPGDEVATATYYVSQSINGCESERTAVDITVNSVGAPEAVPQAFCVGAIVEDLDAVGNGVLWYTSATGGIALDPADAIIEGTYYASQTIDGCESERVSVLVDIIELEVPQGPAVQEFTPGQTLADLDVTGTNIIWYSDSDLTTPIPSSTALEDGTTYYAVASEGTCLSAPLAITADDPLNVGEYNTIDNITFYPNPTIGILNISGNYEVGNITVYDVMGQIIISETVNMRAAEIDLSGLSSGSYFIKVGLGQQQQTIRIIKK